MQSLPNVGELPTMNAYKSEEGGESSEKSQHPLSQLWSQGYLTSSQLRIRQQPQHGQIPVCL